jgi:hypothetical protein
MRKILLTCIPNRLFASTGSHPANASPWLESAPHNLDARRRLLIYTANASLNGPAELTTTPLRAQSAASTHREQLSIPILLPR